MSKPKIKYILELTEDEAWAIHDVMGNIITDLSPGGKAASQLYFELQSVLDPNYDICARYRMRSYGLGFFLDEVRGER